MTGSQDVRAGKEHCLTRLVRLHVWAASSGLLLAAALTSCGMSNILAEEGPSGADGPVIAGWSDTQDAPAAQIEGLLEKAGDCLLVDGKPAVWTSDAMWDSQTESVLLGDRSYKVGEMVSLGGGFYSGNSWEDVVTSESVKRIRHCVQVAEADSVVLIAG